jgi:NADP-dependent 3-hydroxy acid dehydrogenase YdfG
MSLPVAIVTGAGSGLGRATALALSTPELAVVAVGRRAERLRETAAQARGPVRVVAADVADAAARASITAALVPDEQVRFLVHCAGMHAIEAFAAITPDAWRQVMTTNVDARLFLTQQLLPWPPARAFFSWDRIRPPGRDVRQRHTASRRPRASCCTSA